MPINLQIDLCTIFIKSVHRFGQAKIPYVGLVLGSGQFSILPQLSLKMRLSLKEVKIDTKISNSLCESKSLTHSVEFQNNRLKPFNVIILGQT